MPPAGDEEWAGWRAHLNRMVTIRLDKLFELEMEEARRQASRRRR